MRAEMNTEAMNDSAEHSAKYLGALIPGEKRLVLVPIDQQEPWAAFRRMRSWMKESKSAANIDLFEGPAPLEPPAKVISLDSRRKTS